MELAKLGKAPITPGSPAGHEVRAAAAFEALQAEIDKLSNPTNAGATDWSRVADLSASLLEKEGKDLLVASYLAIALTYTRKLAGFKLGMGVMADILATYWENMQPPLTRIRARRNAITWWSDRAAAALQTLEFEPSSPEEIADLTRDVEAIDGTLQSRDPEGPTISTIKALIRHLPVKDQTPAVNGGPPSATKATSPTDISAISSPQDALKMIEALMDNLGQVAGWMIEHDSANSLGYWLNRIAQWWRIQQPPPATEGKSRVPPPAAQAKAELASLASAGNPANLIKFAEAQLGEHPLWLDLNRIVAENLAIQGADFAAAGQVIATATVAFAHRAAGLEMLSFADGSPFADNATRNWMMPRKSEDNAGPGKNEDLSEYSKAVTETEDLAAKGDLTTAAARLQQALRATTSGRQRLLARTRFSEILLNRNALEEPWPYLAALLQAVDRHQLEQFDPELAIRALSVVYRGLNDIESNGKPTRATILTRIAALDYGAALRLSKST
ncbi:MAG: type VI secretion system protein TssA [Candidatus Binataceae bacterium]